MDLASQEFQYTGELALDEGALTLQSPRLKIVEFTYHVEAQKLSGMVRFYDDQNNYSYARPFSVPYDGGKTFEALIVGLTLGYNENVSTI